MNVKEYIKSGAVEGYVLGIATDAERTEFEQMVATYPEVVDARDVFERLLEERLMEDALAPPASLKNIIEREIAPLITDTSHPEYVKEAPVRRMNVWAWVAAASFAGLVGVGIWAYTGERRHQDALARQSQEASTKQAEIERQLQQTQSELAGLQQQASVVKQNPGVRVAAMKGTLNAPQALTTVFWDSTTKDVYLLVNNLPQPASDKQYQLWALLNGQPIDLGVFEAKEGRLMVKMKNVQNAQAFAITLEQKGGSPAPNLEAMYVSGNL